MNNNQFHDEAADAIIILENDGINESVELENVNPSSETSATLETQHNAELKTSGLSDDTIKAVGIRSVSAEDAKKLTGLSCGAGWAVPYHGLKSEPPIWQVKPDRPFKFHDGREAKYLWPQGQANRIYVPPTIMNVPSKNVPITITEGVKKALAATQNGFPTIGLIGVWNWVKDGAAIPDIESIKWHGRKVFLAFDSDASTKPQVRLALYRLYIELSQRGADVLIVNLPAMEGNEKTGIDDYLVSKGPEEYDKLLHEAADFYTWDIKRIASLSGFLQDRAVSELIALISKESPVTQERVGNLLKEFISLSKKTFNDMLERASITSAPSQTVAPTMTAQDELAAMEILKEPELIERLLNDIEKTGCVGDEDNKIALYLALTSRKLEDPINTIIKSESSAGKSYEAKSVVQFIPKEDYLEFTSITPKALFYRKDSLAHKVIIIYERPGAEAADYSLRTLQSEKKLVISTTEKNPETGRFEATDIEVSGPVAYLETTTKAQLHEENETRCFELFVDESVEQTKHIFHAQNAKYLGKSVNVDAIIKPWQDAQRLLKTYPVLIPYIQQVEFPNKPLRVRRDRGRFLALIEASAILHQYQREKKNIDGKEYVVATIMDYAVAYKLAGKIMQYTVTGLSPRLKELLDMASILVDNKVRDEGRNPDEQTITSKELLTTLRWDRKTINKYLKVGNDNGYIELTEGGKGKPYSFKVIRRLDESASLLIPPAELMRRIEPVHLETGVQKGDGQVNLLINKEKTQPVHMRNENE